MGLDYLKQILKYMQSKHNGAQAGCRKSTVPLNFTLSTKCQRLEALSNVVWA